MGWDICVDLKAIVDIDLMAILEVLKFQDRCRIVKNLPDKRPDQIFYAIREDKDSWCLFENPEDIFEWVECDDCSGDTFVGLSHHFSSYKGRDQNTISAEDLDLSKYKIKILSHLNSILDSQQDLTDIGDALDVFYAGTDEEERERSKVLPESEVFVVNMQKYQEALKSLKSYIKKVTQLNSWDMSMGVS